MTSVLRSALLCCVIVVALFASPSATGTYYPQHGDLYYDGWSFADSYFSWAGIPGPWSYPHSGYEHDLAINPQYIYACSTWTNLPHAYDDCPTAGVDEEGGLRVFSFGSYRAVEINGAYRRYYGQWNLTLPQFYFGYYRLNSQEVARTLCNATTIWCMNGVRSVNRLPTGYMIRGTPFLHYWGGGARGGGGGCCVALSLPSGAE
jgi:hypothetical protein